MQHHIRWNRAGWAVVTLLGSMVVATTLVDTYTEALATWIQLVGQ